jgi:hypothetical protein
MIFSECPYCDEPQVFGWEVGDPNGWFPSRCYKCNEVMWVEATSFGGETITHEDFKVKIMHPGDEERVEDAKNNAENLSNVVYD